MAEVEVPVEIGILFDVAILRPLYGRGAYRILFAALDPARLTGCTFWDGDIQVSERAGWQQYCIAVRSLDVRQILHVRDVMSACRYAGLLPPERRFLTGDVTTREPLVPAGAVDAAGGLIVRLGDVIRPEWGDGTAWKVIPSS